MERKTGIILGVGAVVAVGSYALGAGAFSESPRPGMSPRKDESGVVLGLTQPSRDGKKDGFSIEFRGERGINVRTLAPDLSNEDQKEVLTDAAEVIFRSGCDLDSTKVIPYRETTIDGEKIADFEINTTTDPDCREKLTPQG